MAESSPSSTNTKPKEPLAKGASLNIAKKMSWNAGRAVATLLKAVCCFTQLSPGLKLENRSFWEVFVEQSGTVGFD